VVVFFIDGRTNDFPVMIFVDWFLDFVILRSAIRYLVQEGVERALLLNWSIMAD
jgi:hypothetical protein